MRLCIYCGSSTGGSADYRTAVEGLAHTLARQGVTIVYGGGKVGLMGVLATTALAAGGRVVGVMPQSLVDREIAQEGLSELHVVDSMHARKLLMSDLADGFIALPGGAGTLEEIVEQWTWAQLGLHRKPCGFLNVRGYFDPLRTMIDRMVADEFLQPQYADMLIFEPSAGQLLARFLDYVSPPIKWRAEPAG